MTDPISASLDLQALHRPTEGYVFVVTYGRSGSTLLQSLLNTIPGYCIRGENGHALYHVCRLIEMAEREPNFKLRSLDLVGKSKAVPTMGTPADPWYGLERVEVERMGLRFCDLFCQEVLHIPEGTRVAGFKEIRYFSDLNFLPLELDIMQRFFPKARVIFLTRDPEDTANSSWWRNHDKAELLAKLARAHEIFETYAAGHADCFALHHSAYAGGPAALQPLFDFLGETMDVEAVNGVLNRRLRHK